MQRRHLMPVLGLAFLVSCGDPSGPSVGTVTGTVLDPSANGVPDATVTLERSGSSSRTATSGSDGSFTLTNVEEGSWNLSVGAPEGYAPDPAESFPISVSVTAGGTSTVDVPLVRTTGDLTGSVSWSGGGRAGVPVTLAGPAGSEETLTDEAGGYGFERLAPAEYTVSIVVPAGFEPAAGDAEEKSVAVVAGATAEVDFGLVGADASRRFVISPVSLDFGQVELETSSPAQTVTVTNQGPGSVTMSGTGGGAGIFGGVQNCQGTTLAEGDSCQMFYAFSPAVAGEATGSTSGDWNGQDFALEFVGEGVESPRFTISPVRFDFGQVVVGETSPQQTVTVVNNGPGSVVMSGTGGGAGIFGGVQNCQGVTLAEGDACQMLYAFSPEAAGEATGSTSGSWNGQDFAFEFVGEGVESPRFTISPVRFDFGQVVVGETSPQQTVTVTNRGPGGVVMSGAGGGAGLFGGVQNCQGTTLAEGESCQMFYAFSPEAVGETTGSTSGSWNGQTFSFEFAGEGVSTTTERFRISATGFDFGEVPVGQTSPQQTVNVTNLGPGSVVMSGAGGGAGVFGGSQNCQGITLAEGASCQMFYAFTPDQAGEATGTTSGSWNGQAFSFDFRGVGVDRDRFLIGATGFDFGHVLVGTTAAEQTTEVRNLGPGPIVMSGTGGGAGVFGGVQNCQGNTLAEGEACRMFYAFTPADPGETLGATSGEWNGQAFSFDFRGVGFQRDRFLISATGFDFGEVLVGESSEQQVVTVTNLGPGPVEMDGAGGGAGIFGGAQNCQGLTLAEGDSCQMSYQFTPTEIGEVLGTTSGNWSGQPFSLTFRGVGLVPGG